MVVNLQPKTVYNVWLDKDGRTIHVAELGQVPSELWYVPMTILGAELPGGIIGKPYAAIPTSKHYPELKLMVELGVKSAEITMYCGFYNCSLITLLSAWDLFKCVKHQPKIKSAHAQNLYNWLQKTSSRRAAPGTRHELQCACVELWNYTLPVSLGQTAAQQILGVIKNMLVQQLLTAAVHRPKNVERELVLELTPGQTVVKEEEIVTAKAKVIEIEEPQISMEGVNKCGGGRNTQKPKLGRVGYLGRGR